MGANISSTAPGEREGLVEDVEEVTRWTMASVRAAHARLRAKRPALDALTVAAEEAAAAAATRRAGASSASIVVDGRQGKGGAYGTGAGALSVVRQSYKLNRREFWEVFTDYDVIVDDHAFLSLPIDFFRVFADHSDPNSVPGLQVFCTLALLCNALQEEQIEFLFQLFCWGTCEIGEAEELAMVGTISAALSKFGVISKTLAPNGVRAVAASVFERADMNNSEHVSKHEFLRWVHLHSGSADFLDLVKRFHDDIEGQYTQAHRSVPRADAAVRRSSVCSVVSIGSALASAVQRGSGSTAEVTRDAAAAAAAAAATASPARPPRPGRPSDKERRRRRKAARRGGDGGAGAGAGAGATARTRRRSSAAGSSTGRPAADGAGGGLDASPRKPRGGRRRSGASGGASGGTGGAGGADDVGAQPAAAGSGGKRRRRDRGGRRGRKTGSRDRPSGTTAGTGATNGIGGGGGGGAATAGSAATALAAGASPIHVRRGRRRSSVADAIAPPENALVGAGEHRVGDHGHTAGAAQVEVTGFMLNTMADLARVKHMMQRTRDMKLRVVANRRVLLELEAAGVRFSRKELLNLARRFTTESGITGHVDMDAFRVLLESHLPNMAEADDALLQRVFRVMDRDKNNKLDFKEFALGLNVMLKGSLMDKVRFVFKMADQEGKGEMAVAELAHFIRHTHQDLADTIAFAQEVMQSLDVSGDGLMSRNEFQNALNTEPGLMDTLTGLLAVDVNKARPIHQLKVAAPELFTSERLLHMLKRGAHRMNRGKTEMTVAMLRDFLHRHFGLQDGDEEVFHRIDLVHQAFDGEHTGYVSLSKVLLAMAQCFTTDVEEQAETYFELFDISGDGMLDNSEVLHLVLQSRSEAKDSARLVLRTLHYIDMDGDGRVTFNEFASRATRDATLMAALHRLFEPLGPTTASHRHRRKHGGGKHARKSSKRLAGHTSTHGSTSRASGGVSGGDSRAGMSMSTIGGSSLAAHDEHHDGTNGGAALSAVPGVAEGSERPDVASDEAGSGGGATRGDASTTPSKPPHARVRQQRKRRGRRHVPSDGGAGDGVPATAEASEASNTGDDGYDATNVGPPPYASPPASGLVTAEGSPGSGGVDVAAANAAVRALARGADPGFADGSAPRSSIAAIRAGVRADLAPGSSDAHGRRGSIDGQDRGGPAGTARRPPGRSPAQSRRRPRPRGMHRLHHSPLRAAAAVGQGESVGGGSGLGTLGGSQAELGSLAAPLGKAGTLPSLEPTGAAAAGSTPSTSVSSGSGAPSGAQQPHPLRSQMPVQPREPAGLASAPTAVSLVPPHVLSHGIGNGGSWMSAGSDFTISPHQYSPYPESPPRKLLPAGSVRLKALHASSGDIDDVGGGGGGEPEAAVGRLAPADSASGTYDRDAGPHGHDGGRVHAHALDAEVDADAPQNLLRPAVVAT